MACPLSNDLRERVVARHEAGESIRSVTSRFDIAPSTVSKWTHQRRKTGSVGPAKFGGYRRRQLEPHRDVVHSLVAEKPHQRVRELQAELAAPGIRVSEETVRTFLHAEGLSLKKTAFATEQDRPDVARRRLQWQARQASVDPRRLVFKACGRAAGVRAATG